MAFIGIHQGDLPIVKNSFRREGRGNISMILKYFLRDSAISLGIW
jgi:hypothetical protein